MLLCSPLAQVGQSKANCTSTYRDFFSADFRDKWNVLNPHDPAWTGVQAPDLSNPSSLVDWRIDLILAKGNITPIAAHLARQASLGTTKSIFETQAESIDHEVLLLFKTCSFIVVYGPI